LEGKLSAMNLVSFLILMLVQSTVSYHEEPEKHGELDCSIGYHNYNQECTAEGDGYKYCTWKSKSIAITQCTAPKSQCRCSENWWYEMKCGCYNPAKTPPFPETGVIRWSGQHEDKQYNDTGRNLVYRVATINGHIRRDTAGAYFLNESKASFSWRDLHAKPVVTNEITIFQPTDDGSFLKYSRNGKTNKCSVEIVQKSPKLLSGWYINSWGLWELDSEKENKNDVIAQVWKRGYWADDHRYNWEWQIDYDSDKNHGVPKKFVEWADDDSSHWHQITKTYKYVPIGDSDIGINIDDLCYNN